MTHLVIMGVAGCGKSTVGKALAGQLDLPFCEGDEYHPPANIEKMSAGHALTDEDRLPWLRTLVQEMANQPRGLVLSCSALKSSYRAVLRQQPVQFIFLEVSEQTVLERVRERDHFFPEELLKDQFLTLEKPADNEAICVDGSRSVFDICQDVVAQISR